MEIHMELCLIDRRNDRIEGDKKGKIRDTDG